MATTRTIKNAPVVGASSASPSPRKYLLLDTSAYIRLLADTSNPNATEKMKLLFEKQGSGSAYLYMPNFCVAEAFNTFAKIYFREKSISKKDYDEFRETFLGQIKYARMIQSYDLNYYHVVSVDWIVEEEHTFETTSTAADGKTHENRLSTFDILIISMGIELAKIHGKGNFTIITADRRLFKICKKLSKLSSDERGRRKIPESIIFPKCLHIHDIQLSELQSFFS